MRKKYQVAKDSIKAGAKRDLTTFQASGVVKAVEMLCAGDACEVCKKWNGKVMSLKKACKKPPLPIKGCKSKYGYCRCTYLPVMK